MKKSDLLIGFLIALSLLGIIKDIMALAIVLNVLKKTLNHK